MTRFPTFIGAIAMLATALAIPACSDDSSVDTPTSPTVVADPSSTQLFAETLAVGGTAFYSFSVAAYGTVNITLEAVEGALVPPTVMLGLGIGTPSGIDCVTTSTVNTAPGHRRAAHWRLRRRRALRQGIGHRQPLRAGHLPRRDRPSVTRLFLLFVLAGGVAGCDGATDAPSSPTPVATLTTEHFSGSLSVGGHRSYAFSLSEAGAVSLMLASLSTDTSPARPDVRVGLGIGTPAGNGCAIRESVVTTTALASQLRTWAPDGIHCVAIFDTGELPGPVSFAIRLTRF